MLFIVKKRHYFTYQKKRKNAANNYDAYLEFLFYVYS